MMNRPEISIICGMLLLGMFWAFRPQLFDITRSTWLRSQSLYTTGSRCSREQIEPPLLEGLIGIDFSLDSLDPRIRPWFIAGRESGAPNGHDDSQLSLLDFRLDPSELAQPLPTIEDNPNTSITELLRKTSYQSVSSSWLPSYYNARNWEKNNKIEEFKSIAEYKWKFHSIKSDQGSNMGGSISSPIYDQVEDKAKKNQAEESNSWKDGDSESLPNEIHPGKINPSNVPTGNSLFSICTFPTTSTSSAGSETSPSESPSDSTIGLNPSSKNGSPMARPSQSPSPFWSSTPTEVPLLDYSNALGGCDTRLLIRETLWVTVMVVGLLLFLTVIIGYGICWTLLLKPMFQITGKLVIRTPSGHRITVDIDSGRVSRNTTTVQEQQQQEEGPMADAQVLPNELVYAEPVVVNETIQAEVICIVDD